MIRGRRDGASSGASAAPAAAGGWAAGSGATGAAPAARRIEAIEGQRRRRRHQQGQRQHLRPFAPGDLGRCESVPGEGAVDARRRVAGQGDDEAALVAGIDAAHGLPHRRLKGGDAQQIERSGLERHHQQRPPNEEPDEVAEAARQRGKGLEQHRERGDQCQTGQREEGERREDRQRLDRRRARRDQQEHDRGQRQDPNHRRKHQEMAGGLGKRVGDFRHRRRGQDLPDAGRAIAEHRALDHPEAGEGEEGARDHRHQRAGPGRGGVAGEPADGDDDPSLDRLQPEKSRGRHHGEKAAAPHPIPEVGQRERRQGREPAHGTLARWRSIAHR